jgi:hypothetical protein
MISLTKQIEIKTLRDLSDLLYIISMAAVIILSIIYAVFTHTTVPLYGDYSPLINNSPAYIFLLIATIAGLTLYSSGRTESCKLQIAIATAYTALMLCVLLVLPEMTDINLDLNLYSLYPGLLGGLLIWITILLVWIHVFYGNESLKFTKS